MVFLIRDPRDVAASSLDAARKGSWLYERRVKEGGGCSGVFDLHEDALLERYATKYLQNVGNVREAYHSHNGPKVLVRYEDLRTDTLSTMERIYAGLEIPVDEGELSEAVKKHSWESIPEEKGEGKFYRKARPGSWREDLTPEQVEMVERITAPLLKEFYSYGGDSESLSKRLSSSRGWMRMLYGP
jgi:Sulfotransferase domain